MDAASGEHARWARVKAVVLDALDRPEGERAAFIESVTGDDPVLRAEVESLLASDRAAGSFCETPAAAVLGETLPVPDPAVPRLAPGARLGLYEIIAFVAAGGMGEVYRARHTMLGREVAIKIVGAHLHDAAASRRLVREAQHASVLSHQNICAIHDVGLADGVPFIVMEYVNGQPLHEMLCHAVPKPREALEYAVQIADALAHAHAHGIIHRDLKSSNVVVDAAGRPIVLDFGLARRLPDGAGAPLPGSTVTAGGELAGTVSHMAPEVLRGERADARSDVWSLGVLLYELATGTLPFRGRTPFETSSAILGEPARPMGRRVPLALRLVVERCLQKDPAARYQRADTVRDELKRIRRGGAALVAARLLISARRGAIAAGVAGTLAVAAIAIRQSSMRERPAGNAAASTIAILPLRNATGDPRAAYYAEGVTDALTTQLGTLGDVRVLSRVSTSRVAATTNGAADAGTKLGADFVVEGTVERAGALVRLDVSLVAPRIGRVWSKRFEREATEILALEADVAQALAGTIRITIRPGARERLATVRAVSPAVYEEYLKGRFEWNRRTPASIRLAMAHFTRTIELDPTYAPAHAALADCLNQLATVMLGGGSPRELRPRAAAEAIKALQIDPYSAEAHAALGYAWHYDWRFADAEHELRYAIELNPSYSMAHIWYANLLMSRLRMKEAIEQVFAARELDPFSLIVNTNVGWVLNRAGRHEEAVVELQRTLALDSTYAQARWRLAGALMEAGRLTEAIVQAARLVALSDSAPAALALLASIEARAGRNDDARGHLRVARVRAGTRYLPPASIAGVFAALGQTDSAITWLEKAFDERSNAIVYLAADEYDARIRRDPRFRALLARAGLE